MALELVVTAAYNKDSDFVEVSFFKHDAGNQQAISSGIISLLQNGDELKAIEVDATSQNVRFFHPKYISGLTVHAEIDSLVADSDLINSTTLNTHTDFSQPPTDEENDLEYDTVRDDAVTTGETTVVNTTTSTILGPVIFDVNFNELITIDYSGGNRVLFDFDGRLVLQPLDVTIAAPKYSETSTVNLLPDLISAHEITYEFGGANQYIVNDFGYESLRIKALGGSQGDEPNSNMVISLIDPLVGGKTAQMFFGFNHDITPDKFRFVTRILDNTGTVIDIETQVLDVIDFVGQISMIASTLTTAGDMTYSIEIDDVSGGDIFDMDFLLAQVTTLEQVTSFTPDTRVKDIFSSPLTITNEEVVTFEIDLAVGDDLPRILFEYEDIIASYDGSDIVFNVNGTSIATTLSLSGFNNYRFMVDTINDELSIEVDNVTLITGGAGFALGATTGTVFIGCDKTGDNQINGQLNRFRVLR